MPWQPPLHDNRFPPSHDITQMSSGLLGRAGKTLETMPTCPGTGLYPRYKLPKTETRLRNQELWKTCPPKIICMETWHIVSPRDLHKPWGAFSAHFTEIFQWMMKFWFPVPRKPQLSLCSFGLDLNRGIGSEHTYPDVSMIQSFRTRWASCSQHLGAGTHKAIETKFRTRRSSKLPSAEQVPSSSFGWTCWISEGFKVKAGELLNVDMFYSWKWNFQTLKHTGCTTVLWTWNEWS